MLLQIISLTSIIQSSNAILTSQGTYQILSGQLTWDQAETECNQRYGTSLATVLTSADNLELTSGMNTYKSYIAGNVWIGWRKRTSTRFIWAPCSYPSCAGTDWKCYANDEVYSGWHSSEGNWDANKLCGGIKQSSSDWHDRECSTKRDFACNSNTGKYKNGSALCIKPTPNPTESPTPLPTIAPTINPSRSPTAPTIAPTDTPTYTPTACIDFNPQYNSSDGVDKLSVVTNHQQTVNYSDASALIDYYIASDVPFSSFYATQIPCNNTVADVCLIECHFLGSCAEMIVKPLNQTNLKMVTIICDARMSCRNMRVNISNNMISELNILCVERFSCMDGIIAVESDHRDRRYIRYPTNSLLDPYEILISARQEYSPSNKLPCEDIKIDCTGYNTDFERECEYEYKLSDTVDLFDILNDTERPNCYWLDIGAIIYRLMQRNM